jgi:FHS family L-fucose permease-like MFS transporter
MVSFYWGGAMIGRFIGSVALRKLSDGTALGCATIAAALLTIGSMMSGGHLAMALILMVGLFNSIMFPDIFNLGIAKMGRLTGEASGLMIAAIVGGAIIPILQGALADRIGLQSAFVVPVLCYVYLCYYGFKGSKPYRLKEVLED